MLCDLFDETIISRQEAIVSGLKHYFTGRPCKHGHVSTRYTNSRICAECLSLENKRTESIEKIKRWYRGKTHREKMLMWAKYRHVRKKYPGTFNLTEDDLLWPEFCPALGIRLKYESQTRRTSDDAPTIDRIDSSKGYVKGNFQVLSRRANRIKNDGSADEVLKVALFMFSEVER